MLKHNLLIESGSIGTDMVENRLVCLLADKDASRLPEIVRLTITLFECPCPPHTHIHTPLQTHQVEISDKKKERESKRERHVSEGSWAPIWGWKGNLS